MYLEYSANIFIFLASLYSLAGPRVGIPKIRFLALSPHFLSCSYQCSAFGTLQFSTSVGRTPLRTQSMLVCSRILRSALVLLFKSKFLNGPLRQRLHQPSGSFSLLHAMRVETGSETFSCPRENSQSLAQRRSKRNETFIRGAKVCCGIGSRPENNAVPVTSALSSTKRFVGNCDIFLVSHFRSLAYYRSLS